VCGVKKKTVDDAIAVVERRLSRQTNAELRAADESLLRMMRRAAAGGGRKIQLRLFPGKRHG